MGEGKKEGEVNIAIAQTPRNPSPIPVLYCNPGKKNHDQNFRCFYHMDATEHSLENFWNVKYNIQDLSDAGFIYIGPPNAQEYS